MITSIWIPIALISALMQTVRNGLFKHAKNNLTDDMVLLVRFALAMPFAWLFLACFAVAGYVVPAFNAEFLTYAFTGAVVQIVGGFLFLALFGRRNFIIGVTYGKTEALQAAIFGAILFSEYISFGAWVAIMVGMAGIIIISVVKENIEPVNILRRMFSKSAQIGFACGALFGLTSVLIRQSIVSLGDGEFFMRSTFTMAVMFTMQTFIMLAVFAKSGDISRLNKIVAIKKDALLIGFVTAISAFGWFIAFSLANAAYVSLVGQVELLFSFLLTRKVFKESVNKTELLGIFLVFISVLSLIYV